MSKCEAEERCWVVREASLPEPMYLRYGPANLQLTLLQGERGADVGGWFFPDYGIARPTSTLVFRSYQELPHDSFFEIRA